MENRYAIPDPSSPEYDVARGRGYDVERLLHLRRVNREIPEDKLDMETWGHEWLEEDGSSCGMVRCLGGWLFVDGWFLANTDIGRLFQVEGYGDLHRMVVPSIDNDRSIYGALSEMFGISHESASNLFGGAHKTKEQLEKRIGLLLTGETVLTWRKNTTGLQHNDPRG